MKLTFIIFYWFTALGFFVGQTFYEPNVGFTEKAIGSVGWPGLAGLATGIELEIFLDTVRLPYPKVK